MDLRRWALIFVFAISGLPIVAGDAKWIEYEADGKTRRCSLFVPEDLDPERLVALLVTLHGSGRQGDSLVEPWEELAGREGFIVAGPNSLDPNLWNTPDDSPEPIHVLVETLKAEYRIDPRRVYVFGHSGGANQALRLAAMEPAYFAGIALHAGALSEGDYWLLDLQPERVPVGIVVGTRDRFYPVREIEKTRDVLQQKGFEVVINIVDGHDHNYYRRSEQINDWVWAFLKDKVLAHDPIYQEYTFPGR